MAVHPLNFASWITDKKQLMERKWEQTAVGGKRNFGVRTSRVPGSDRVRVPEGASRCVRYGDRIFVRMVNLQRGWEPVAEFELTDVNDMSEVYGVLRQRTRGASGLMRLYVRNATRGWSFDQPFRLYSPAAMQRASTISRGYAIAR